MGVGGLTTYIQQNESHYLENYYLHDSLLVIDGLNAVCNIHFSSVGWDGAFGGNYDRYAQAVSDFFDDLLRCNVTPIVIFDGAIEERKVKTVLQRSRSYIMSGLYADPINSCKTIPPFVTLVFLDVIKQKGIKHIQCLFEADNTIAAVAKVLGCPVLSHDSDFYIYGSLYISFHTLGKHVTKVPNGQGYAIQCKIYRVKKFLNSFNGLTPETLSLAAILLGNDYVERGTFSRFLSEMKLPGKRGYRQQCRIENTFTWLSRYNLNTAVTLILSKVRKPLRKKILDTILEGVNNYETQYLEIFKLLGLEQECTDYLKRHVPKKPFEYHGDIYNLQLTDTVTDISHSDASDSDGIDDLKNEIVFGEPNLIYDLPAWFREGYTNCIYPAFSLNFITHRFHIPNQLIEEPSLPPAAECSFQIIAALYGLLISDIYTKYHTVKCFIRGERGNLKVCHLRPVIPSMDFEHCSLHNLPNLTEKEKMDILLNTLDINEPDYINEFPPQWRLYIACIRYWLTQTRATYDQLDCYLYSLVFGLFIHLIDNKIGRHRSLTSLEKKYKVAMSNIEDKRKNQADKKKHYPINVTIQKACDEFEIDDCLQIAPFFISNSQFDETLRSNPKKYNRICVHAFSEFQMSLKHGYYLNALLGFPYQNIDVAKLFNGTFLYNVYNNFKSRQDVKAYIKTLLQHSPSIFRLFEVLIEKLGPLFSAVLADNITQKRGGKKKRQRKSKRKTTVTDENTEELNGTVENSEEPNFTDSNNYFSILAS